MSAAPGVVYYLNGQNNNLSYEKEVKDNGWTHHKHYLSAGGVVFAMQVTQIKTTDTAAPTVNKLQYLHHDHLGSVSVITDETGSVIQDGRLAYDPWGKRRLPNGTADTADSVVGLTLDRGFTMHEHLDEMGVIHMNGRIYDPLIGRFMSADPFIQAPENLQSHNRFAYVMNNPLSYTDPSGYFSLKKLFRAVVAIAVGYFTGQWIGNMIQAGAGAGSSLVSWSTNIATGGSYASGLSGLGGALAGAGGGFAAGLVGSGSLKGALQGAFSGGVFGAIGGIGGANEWSTGQYVAAHAAGGCITSVAGGGQCGSGALSAAFGKFATLEGPQFDNLVADGIKAAVVGGIGSVIGGGKFENGATTAAFAYIFNNCFNLPGGCRGFAERTFKSLINAFRPPVPVGATLDANTFVLDYGVSFDTSGRVYVGAGRSLLPGETPGVSFRVHLASKAWTPQEKVDFFEGVSYSLSVTGAGGYAGRSYSPAGPTTFLKTTDIGVSTQQGVGASTGISTCVMNCPKN